ncbi:MAG: hypothetical protein N2490_06920 [Ignavibacteria bacterium]|nr:hypothetical protein [Ignavibacteria bacterium]
MELIVINKSNINNKVEFTSNNEINFNGIMYEVSRIDEDESNIYIYCIKDEEETNLINSYKKLISNTNNNTKSKNTQNIMCFYFLGLLNNLITIPKNNNFLILSLFTKENIIHNFIPPLSPPPKIFITLKNI